MSRLRRLRIETYVLNFVMGSMLSVAVGCMLGLLCVALVKGVI